MFHGTQIKDKLNELCEKTLRIVYNGTVLLLEDLPIKDKSLTIHH